MSGSSTTQRSARFLTADYLIRGRDNPVSCPLWQNGALVAPTEAGSTVSVYDAAGELVVDAVAVTVTDSIATYTIQASALPSTLQLGMGWRIEWSLIISGTAYPYRNAAGLVRSQLAPVITDGDLFRRESALDPAGAAPVSSLDDYQDFIDEAWVTILGRLTGKGSLPHLIMEPSALRECHLLLTLHLVFQDFRTRLNETWKEKSDDYKGQYTAAWNDLRFEYDTTDSGKSDGRRKRGGSASHWLCGRD